MPVKKSKEKGSRKRVEVNKEVNASATNVGSQVVQQDNNASRGVADVSLVPSSSAADFKEHTGKIAINESKADFKQIQSAPKNLTNSSEKGYVIHVPQGRTARLIKAGLPGGMIGLYTDSFSSCNIVIFIGLDKISLTHVDNRNIQTNLLNEEEKWVGKNCEMLIVAREEGVPLKNVILSGHKNTKIRVKIVDDEIIGLLASFEVDQSNIAIHPMECNVKFSSATSMPQRKAVLA